MANNSAVRLEDLPAKLQEDIAAAAGLVVPKRHRRKRSDPVTRGEVLLVAAQVLGTLYMSGMPVDSWYRVMGTVQRWVRNPGRMQKGRVVHDR